MRKTKRVKKRAGRTRKMRGGKKEFLPPAGLPNWPKIDGCVKIKVNTVELTPGTLIDRIGPMNGRFVAVLKKKNGKAKPSSYASRSLRALGETPYPFIKNGVTVSKDLREELYKMIYTPINDKYN